MCLDVAFSEWEAQIRPILDTCGICDMHGTHYIIKHLTHGSCMAIDIHTSVQRCLQDNIWNYFHTFIDCSDCQTCQLLQLLNISPKSDRTRAFRHRSRHCLVGAACAASETLSVNQSAVAAVHWLTPKHSSVAAGVHWLTPRHPPVPGVPWCYCPSLAAGGQLLGRCPKHVGNDGSPANITLSRLCLD